MPTKKTKTNKPSAAGKAVTHADVRMYRLGTGDCFAIKFYAGKTVTFRMMIDCGAWQGSKAKFAEHVTELKKFVDNRVDLLVVTHEHKDHVLGFELCEDLFTNGFEVGETWMAWTEEDGDPLVEQWKRDDGLRKNALARAAHRLNEAVAEPGFTSNFQSLHRGAEMLDGYRHFATVLREFTELQMAVNGKDYAGPLKGMKAAKEKIARGKDGKPNIRYRKPGDILEQIPGLEGVRIYVLGPPRSLADVHREDSDEEGETYDHNKELAKSHAFALAANALDSGSGTPALLPFDRKYEAAAGSPSRAAYDYKPDNWRRIDHDWLMSAGPLALRLNSGINNLSLAFAIEFTQSGRVMLFPGDAEYGSWASWHRIAWTEKGRGKKADGTPKDLTEDLLNRTVFYKVAHHLSHNGTARRKGLEMMTDQNLSAMATLDYGVISEGWTGTMPNQGLLEELLTKTRGRLMVMKTKDLYFDARKTVPLEPKIRKARAEMSAAEAKAFQAVHTPPKDTDLHIEFRVLA